MDISIGLALLIHQSHLTLLAINVSTLFNLAGIQTFEALKLHRTLDLVKDWVRTARRWLAMALLAAFLNGKVRLSLDTWHIGTECIPPRPSSGLVDISNTNLRPIS